MIIMTSSYICVYHISVMFLAARCQVWVASVTDCSSVCYTVFHVLGFVAFPYNEWLADCSAS